MDTIYQNICGIRKNKNRDGEKHIWEEIEDASKDGTTIPLEAFPVKIQEMAKVLVEYEITIKTTCWCRCCQQWPPP